VIPINTGTEALQAALVISTIAIVIAVVFDAWRNR
jgi:hypothetical protein